MITALIEWLDVQGFGWKPADVDLLAGALGMKFEGAQEGRRAFSAGDARLVEYSTAAGLKRVEVVYWCRDAPEEDKAYRREVKAFQKEYRQALERISESVTKPEFEGTVDDEGFPSGQDAVRLALWQRFWGRLILKSQHEGREIPLRVTVVLERNRSLEQGLSDPETKLQGGR